MKDSASTGAMKTFTETMRSIGQAAAGAKDMNQVLTELLGNISSQLSEIFLWAALSAFKDGMTEVGIAFLIAAGATALIGGFIGGGGLGGGAGSRRGASSVGSGGTIYGANSNIQTAQVVNNWNVSGSVWQTDDLENLAASSAQAAKSGR